MVVDDEKDLRMLYRCVLEDDGHSVVTAGSAEECLHRIGENPPDLVVMDIRMPGMNGIEAMGRILEFDRTIPVVLYSGYTGYRDNFLSWLADAYLVKSSDTGELRRTVNRILAKRVNAGHRENPNSISASTAGG
jgi:CheY-like chemotaxis protein